MMRIHARAIATKALYVLLAFIIATGGYFAKQPEPVKAELWWAQSWGTRSFVSVSGFYVVYFNCHVQNVGNTGHTIWDSVVYMKQSSPPWDSPLYDSGNIGSARGGLAPGSVMNANQCATLVSPNQTYYWAYRYREMSGGPWGDAGVQSFSTYAPGVSSYDASSVGTTTATLNGHLDGSGSNDADLNFVTSWAGTIAGSPSSASSATNFSAGVSGLAAGTAYSYHAQASNVWGTTNGAEKYFTTTTTPPSVTTSAASALGTTTATLNGNLSAVGTSSPATLSFEYGLNTGYGSTAAGVPPSTGSVPTAFNAGISSLTPGTLYHYRAKAVTGHGTTNGGDQTFTTLTTPPSVTTNAASALTYHSATLNGNLSALGTASPATLSFDYGLNTGYGSTTAGVPSSSGSPTDFTAALDPLTAGTTYHFRAKAVTAHGTTNGTDQSFTTYTKPSVSAAAASYVTYQSATLNGNVTSLGSAPSVNVSFDYGTSSGSYTLHTAPASQGSGVFTAPISSLSHSTTYYWRAVADGGATYGTSYSTPEQSFTTKTPSAVSTDIATGISGGNVTLNGALTSMGTATSIDVNFEYGNTSGGPYGSSTTPQARTTPGAYSQALSLANGTYYYRAEADGGIHGPANGAEKSFTIGGGSASPSATTEPATSIGGSSATLNGNITNMGSASSVNWCFQYGTASGYYTTQTTPTTKSAAGPVSLPLAGLSASTTYYYRVKIDAGAAGGVLGSEKSFTTGLTCPTANTDTATAISANGATLNGNLLSFGTAAPPVSVSFQYGTTSGIYPYDTAEQAKGAPGTFSAPLSGLAAATTYYYRARVDDGTSGGIFGAEKSFLTGSTCPSATTQTATGITASGANLQGNLVSTGSASTVNTYFQWGTVSGVYANEATAQVLTSAAPFNAAIGSLTNGVIYYYRAKVDGGSAGGSFGDEKSFTAGRTCPTVNTDTPTSITADGATLNANLLTMGTAGSVSVSFQYGTASGSYPLETPQLGKGAPGTFNAPLSGLGASMIYYYRAKVDDGTSGGVFGAEKSFRTGSTCPMATTQTATDIGATSATLQGNLLSLGTAASVGVTFQWGTASGVYANETPPQTLSTLVPFTADLTGLGTNTTYFYRAKADGGLHGSVFGIEKSFTTGLTCPIANTDTPTLITADGATLNGNLLSLGTAAPPVKVSFQWGSASGVYPFETTQADKAAAGTFNAPLSGLAASTTYYYRAKVDDGVSGGIFGAEKALRTGSTCPTATSELVNPIGATTATLHGNLAAKGTAATVNVTFQWGSSPGVYINETAQQPLTAAVPFTANLTGLTYGNTYYYRAKADGGIYGSAFGNEMTFRTDSTPPTILTDTPTAITLTGATVNGVLTTMGTAPATDASFKWGIASSSYPNETPQQAMGAPGTFNYGLTTLTNGATYYYRAKAVRDPHGGAFGDELAFLTGSTCPTATTQTATSITATTASLNGNLLTMGTATSINACFQWGTASGVYASQTPVHSVTSPQPFTADLGSLTNGTRYYYRAKADGGVYGSVFGVEKSFIAGSTPLTIITDTPTDITVSSARVNGVLTSLGGIPNALVSFQYGTASGVYPFETTQQPISAAGTFNFNITPLSTATTYYYRAKVDDGTSGGAFGDELSFLTGSTCPTATTQTATSITASMATLNGNLLTMGTATSINACFQWGTSSGVYANQTPVHSVTWPQPFTADLGGLTNGTTYYYRAKADGGVYGSVFGVEKSLTAGTTCPTIITDTPTDIAAVTARLNGILTLPGSAAYPMLVSFQWGSASGIYPYETPQQSRNAAGTFNAVISGLTSGSTYYYRAKVDDGTSGGAFGIERHFIAGSTCPTGTTQTATSITTSTATLNGNLLTLGSAGTVNVMFQWGTVSTVYANETTPLNVPSERPFTFGLAGLANGTTYYYRAKIDGGVYGSVFGVEKSFTAGSTPLTILTDTPTSIAPASATLNGILTSLGGVPNALVSFQWGSAAGVYPFETTQRSKSTGGTFTDNISGLTSGSLYYYRAKVDDGTNGGAFGVERSFRAGATCPTGTTQTATAIGTATVTLNGNLLTLGSASSVNVMFQWGTASTHYVNETTPQPMSSGAPFAAGLSGLANGTTYYYRAKIDGGVNGSIFGVEKSFTAGKTNPVVTTDGVTTITPTGGTLNGILMSLGTSDNASVSFQWGTTGGVYPYETPLQLQTRPIAFTAGLTGLTDNVTYYYRARVDDCTSGGAFGLERTFRAGATCPTATTQTATGITATTAILQGNLLTRGSASVVDACFQWGTTPLGYVNQTPLQAMDSGAPFLETLTGLVDGTRYYYRARVDGGSNGMCLGVEKSFIAGRNPPVVLTDTPTSISASSATLNGIMTTLGTAPNALVSFQWGTTTGVYPDETPQQDYNAAGTFTDNLTGLSDNITYYYRAKADDGVSGGAFGVERAFRAGTTCPIASTEPATEVSTNAALLHANLTSLGSATSCNITFEWGSVSTVYPSETAHITRTALGIVSCNLTGLAPDTQYFFRAKADGGLNGSALGLEKNFFTGRTPPTVTTDPAYVTTTTATLRGNLVSLGTAPSCNMTFEWGRTPGIYLFETPVQTENVTGVYQADITGLSPNTNYYFRGKADGGTHGGAFSAERTLLTAGATSRASGTTPAGGTAIVEFSSSAGNLSGLTAAAASSLPCSFGMVKFPFGIFSFTISNLPPGGTAVVRLGLPDSIADSAMYYKCQNGMSVDCTSLLGHNDGDNILTLTLTDGELGDGDGQRNSIIVDPGGPVLRDLPGGQRQGSSPMISTTPPSQMPANPGGIAQQSTVDRSAATMALANIVVISAVIERHEASAGEPVKVTAMVSNKGGEGGTAKIMVTVNGYEADSQGVTVGKDGTVPVEFYVSGDSPGQYRVYVNNVSAGEFYVSPFRLSDLILWFSTACVLASLILAALYILRRRRDGY